MDAGPAMYGNALSDSENDPEVKLYLTDLLFVLLSYCLYLFFTLKKGCHSISSVY